MQLPLDQILQGDALERLKELPADSIDFICTDPPYGIGFMGKEWDTFSPGTLAAGVDRSSRKDDDLGQAAVDKDPRRSKAGRGSVAMEAARYDHTPQGQRKFREWWHEISIELLRVLKPGAFATVCIGARQDSVAACITAMSEAGFKTDFTSLFWAYASGFPKAANISKMVDRRAGLERKGTIRTDGSGTGEIRTAGGRERQLDKVYETGDPVSAKAQALDGSYAGYQPKPAVEVIVVAMKPLSEKTFVDQALKNGKGVSWLDKGRIPFKSDDDKASAVYGGYVGDHIDHADQKYGLKGQGKNIEANQGGRFPANLLVSDGILAYDSRYFDLGRWARTLPFLNVPKPASSEKHGGLEHTKDKIMARSGGAQNAVTDGDEEYLQDHIGLNRVSKVKNHHPTVKPIALMSYLITLFSREGDVVLDPFLGSGTTCIAAAKLRRKYVGIDREAEYVELAKSRLEAAQKQVTLL